MSRVIKSYKLGAQKRRIEVLDLNRFRSAANASTGDPSGKPEKTEDPELARVAAISNQMIRNAESEAERILAEALEQAAKMREQAQKEIESWWEEKRAEDEFLKQQAMEEGRALGYEDGVRQARRDAEERHAAMIEQAAQILRHAQQTKDEIIAQAEPFLVELSTKIAEKIIDRQLSLEPGWIIDLARKYLQRRKEQGVITLVVSPDNYPVFSDAKEDLQQAAGAGTDLIILPDPSVEDHGCQIRSSFGTLDARMDTQLKEIREALMQLASKSGEADRHDQDT